ncbi:hypothetical protein [Actinomadura logoneensis]|uniref:hypothetical protein n=1 Tax=Actinomadura logoneensis TaxID=2293572 RepID=UPI0011C0E9AB|nr:hypothetical protein [Actinomadura logoneensis]
MGDFSYHVGKREYRVHNAPDGPCHSLPKMGTRFVNHTGTTVKVFWSRHCKGHYLFMEPHSGSQGAPLWGWSFRFLP